MLPSDQESSSATAQPVRTTSPFVLGLFCSHIAVLLCMSCTENPPSPILSTSEVDCSRPVSACPHLYVHSMLSLKPATPSLDDFVRIYHGQVEVAVQLQTNDFEGLYGDHNPDVQKELQEKWQNELNQYFFDGDDDGALVEVKCVKKNSLQLNLSLPIGCYARMVDEMKQKQKPSFIPSLSHLPLKRAEPLTDHVHVYRLVALCVVGEDKRDLWQLTSPKEPVPHLPAGIRTQEFTLKLDEQQRRQLSDTPVQRRALALPEDQSSHKARARSAAAASDQALASTTTHPSGMPVVHVPRPPPMLGVNYWATEGEWDPELDGHWGSRPSVSSVAK